MKKRRTMRRIGAGLLAVACAGLAACTSDSPKPSGKCEDVCTGKISGASYSIRVPKSWNGKLVIYEHGYRTDLGKGPGKPALSQLDKTGRGDDSVSSALLSAGYALAGSSYASAGWALGDAVQAANDLYARFTKTVRKPQRTLVWGSSLGGLATEVLAETVPWIDGAAPMCGVVAGPDLLFDHLLEAEVATKALLAPKLKVSGWSSATDALKQLSLIAKAIKTAGDDSSGTGPAKLEFLANYLGLPKKTQYFDGTSAKSAISAAGFALQAYLTTGIGILFEGEHRYGGEAARFSGNAAQQLNAADAADVTALGGNATAFAATVAAMPAVADDASARKSLIADGEPTGKLRVPTLTMHTEYDPDAIVAHESVLRGRVAAAGQTDRLDQVYIAPPDSSYGAKLTPDYGVGHCSFSGAQMTGLIKSLDTWVSTARKPTPAALSTSLGSGVDAAFTPPAWPVPAN